MTWVLAVVVGVSVAVGLLTGVGWPGVLIGAALSLSLWVMLLFGIHANLAARAVPAGQFALAAAAAVAVGYMIFRVGGSDPATWSVGFIAAGAGAFALAAVQRHASVDSEDRAA
ncbi:MAG: hypothetical protein ABIS84_06895 [Arachnia sp.]